MFKVLDEDGSNSLSIGEITKLFKENGINMTRTEVALMFANAQCTHLQKQFHHNQQTGGKSNPDVLLGLKLKPISLLLK